MNSVVEQKESNLSLDQNYRDFLHGVKGVIDIKIIRYILEFVSTFPQYPAIFTNRIINGSIQ